MKNLFPATFFMLFSSFCFASHVYDIPLTEYRPGLGGGGEGVEWTSLALDSSDSPHVAFRDINGGNYLTYIKKGLYGWGKDPILKLENNPASFISLALNPQGTPRISFYRSGSGLVFASKEGSHWDLSVVDPDCLGHTSLKIDSNGVAHISYYANQTLKYAMWDGVRWTTSTVDAGGNVGMWNALALDLANRPLISYYDSLNRDLKIARWDGHIWSTQTVVSEGNVGMYSSIAMDSHGNPSLSYIDEQNGLKFAYGDGTAWTIQTVDAEGEAFTSLRFDSTDVPYIAFASAGGKFKVVFFKNAQWNYYLSNDQKGKYCSLALSRDNRPHAVWASPLLWYLYEDPFPGPTFLSGATALSTHTITWSWQDNSTNEKGFQILRASDMAPITADLPPNTTYWVQKGLTANTSSDILVRAFNDTEYRDSFAMRVVTYALPPSDAKVVESGPYSVKVSWSANNNPPNTQYKIGVYEKTGSIFTPNPLFVYVGTSTSGWTPTLKLETTYYIDVYALNDKGTPSLTPAVTTAYLEGPTPADPGIPWSTEQTTGSISWAWLDNSKIETNYLVAQKNWEPLSPFLAPNTTAWVQTGLAPNTSSQIRIFAYKDKNFIISDPSKIVYSLANAPTGGSAVFSNGTALDVSWSANGNSPGTDFQLEESMNGISFSNVYAGTSTALSLTQRSEQTTYYYRVRAINHAGEFTDYSSVFRPSVPLPPIPPLPQPLPQKPEIPLPPKDVFGEQISTHAIRWVWIDPSNNEQGFRVRKKSDGTDLSGALPMNTTYWIQTGAEPFSLNEVTVESFNQLGVSSKTISISVRSKANTPTGFIVQQMGPTHVLFVWNSNGNPEAVRYRIQGSLDSTFANIAFDVTNIDKTSHRLDRLSRATTYYFRLFAEGNDPIAINPIFTPNDNQLQFLIEQKRGTTINWKSADGELSITVPAGAFEDSVNFSVKEMDVFPKTSEGLEGLGIGFQIISHASTKPSRTAIISFSLQRITDPKYDIEKLSLARYDTSQKAWVLLPSKVDIETRSVEVETNDFSIFQLVYPQKLMAVDNVIAYPVPFRSGSGENLIHFKQMPVGSEIRIYTFSGILVKEIRAESQNVLWDVKNDNGENVTSGVYFVRVSGSGGDKTLKIVVQR